MIIVQRQPDLLQVVGALGTSSRLARRLHRGQQERDQHRDDGNDNEQFNQREPSSGTVFHGISPGENNEKERYHTTSDDGVSRGQPRLIRIRRLVGFVRLIKGDDSNGRSRKSGDSDRFLF